MGVIGVYWSAIGEDNNSHAIVHYQFHEESTHGEEGTKPIKGSGREPDVGQY
jgi:hypothetical protein